MTNYTFENSIRNFLLGRFFVSKEKGTPILISTAFMILSFFLIHSENVLRSSTLSTSEYCANANGSTVT